jgi:hypothetical protein
MAGYTGKVKIGMDVAALKFLTFISIEVPYDRMIGQHVRQFKLALMPKLWVMTSWSPTLETLRKQSRQRHAMLSC